MDTESSHTAHVSNHVIVDRPTAQQLTSNIHPYHNGRQKWSLLLCGHSLNLCKIFTFTWWSFFLEMEWTWNFINSSLFCKDSIGNSFLFFFSKTLSVWIYLWLYMIIRTAFIWNCNILKFISISFPYFSQGVTYMNTCFNVWILYRISI
jgi:hypothetical protein